MIYVAKISYRDAGGTAQVAYFTTGQGWKTRSTDTPASTHIRGGLRNPGAISRSMFRDAAAFGPVEQGFGAVELDNSDGDLDAWVAYHLAGNEYEVFALTYEGEPSSSWLSPIKLRMMFARFSSTRVTIALRDRLQELEVPLAKNFFAGTGALEGESFAANVRKPWGAGDCFNVEPILINDDTYPIYVVHDGAIDSATVGRYERAGGAVLNREANYASEAALFSTPPSVGYVKRWPTGGAFRVGVSSAYPITSDISFGSTTDKLAHQVLKTMAIRAGISSGDINATDISDLDASPTVNSGYYVKDAETAFSAMSKIALGGGLWFGFDRTGVMRVGKIDTYSGSAVYAFTEHNTLEIVRDVSGGLTSPIWAITMRWKKRWKTMADVGGAASLTERQEQSAPWSEYRTTDAGTLTNNPYAQSIVRDTYSLNLDSVAAPSVEAARQLALFKVLRAVYRVRARITGALLSVDLGSTVSLMMSRFGLTSATNFKVIGTEFDFGADAVTYTLWG